MEGLDGLVALDIAQVFPQCAIYNWKHGVICFESTQMRISSHIVDITVE